MASILNSQSVGLATAAAAMAAFSGTVILLAFKLQKPCPPPSSSSSSSSSPSHFHLRPCLASGERKGEKKKKKKVRFAEDVVDPKGDNQAFRRRNNIRSSSSKNVEGEIDSTSSSRMPANRVALYNGILKHRVIHRTAYSY